MSQSQHLEQQRAAATSDSPYRRDGWWGDNDTADDERTGHDPKPFNYNRERAAYVAHSYHRDRSDKLCPVTLFSTPDNQLSILFDWLEQGYSDLEHDPFALHYGNRETELTDPELHVPHDAPDRIGVTEYGQKRHRNRFNDSEGYITGPYLADLSADKFSTEVDDLLEFWGAAYGLTDDDCEALRNRAKRLKHQGDHRDVDILEHLILEVTTDGSIADN